MAQMNMIEAIRSALDIVMDNDPNVVVLGEDVGYFGGVFRCTDGLQRKYGDHRVIDAPIAEGGIIGAAIGMGLNGLRPATRSAVTARRVVAVALKLGKAFTASPIICLNFSTSISEMFSSIPSTSKPRQAVKSSSLPIITSTCLAIARFTSCALACPPMAFHKEGR